MAASNSDSIGSKRPRVHESEPKVTIKIKTQDGNEDMYKIGYYIELKKLLKSFCERKNLDYRTVRFIYGGHLINPRQTPAKLMIEDGDEIDAFMELPGGGSYVTVKTPLAFSSD